MPWADPADNASEVEAAHNAAAETAARGKSGPEQRKDANGNWETVLCVDCDEEIEPARLEMGRVRCFHCQSVLEKRNSMYAKR